MEKQLLFVEEEWVKGNTCLYMINNPIEKASIRTLLEQKRRDFIKKLENEGFEITFDKGDLSNAIYIIMNNIALTDLDTSIYEYQKLFDARMQEAGGEEMNVPYTVSVLDYFANPFFPAVFKNIATNGGEDKLLMENIEQLSKIKQFYEENNNNSSIMEKFSMCIFQEYIETPTKYSTYIRVLMGASGDIMGASLKYSSLVEQSKPLNGYFEKVFCDPQSKYFLNCKNMFGYYSLGGEISFSQPRYSDEKKAILEAHNIDKDHPEVPLEIKNVAANIMQECNKELGIIVGFDFIQNAKNGKWYYLENQAFPAIDEWAKIKGYDIPKVHTPKNYLKYLELDMAARYEALKLLMAKKEKERLIDTNSELRKQI